MLPPMLSAKLTGIIIIWDLYTSRHYLQHIVLNIGILRYHNIVHTGVCTTKKFCINDQWRGNEILWLSNTLENDKQAYQNTAKELFTAMQVSITKHSFGNGYISNSTVEYIKKHAKASRTN